MYISRLLHEFLLLIVIFYVYKIQSEEILYDTIVCFGDSNSDTGNVYNLTNSKWPIAPPYEKGRFSNGPIWIEKLGISNLMNYAYGGATTDNNLVQGYTAFNLMVPGIRQQITTYKNITDFNKISFNRTIYIIWAGGNDYSFNISLSPSSVVKSLINGINDLMQIGAKHFLIVNQPPIQAYPAASGLNMSDYLTKVTLEHNTNLSNSIQLLQSNYSNISFKLFDVYSLIANILMNVLTYGINSTTNCWSTPNYTVIPLCSTPNTYIYIDNYHFTTRIHQLIGGNAPGGNDYSFNISLSASSVVKSLINGINDLIQIGAKHFLIVNQPPRQAYPAAQALNIPDYIKTLTFDHNSNLSNSIQLLQTNYSNISIKLFDVYSLISNILINPSVYGITSTKTCWNILDNTVIQLYSTPDTYLYIDGVHFTTRIHQLIADNARKLLVKSKETIKSHHSIFSI
ncbi:unnamed protein product [Rotaria sordida]|uniref:Uncharacterized protein n=1 Tax=Rotaria sordida TaxID=392033 RepID=A0A814Y3A1_9BILA|nr:unnamed protein product [Rotaria sordida]